MIPALLGGALIGLAASLFWFANGRIAGVSGVLYDAIRGEGALRVVRVAFLLGLLAAGVAAKCIFGVATSSPASLPVVGAAGLLVGFGARLGGGCTSGRWGKRSRGNRPAGPS